MTAEYSLFFSPPLRNTPSKFLSIFKFFLYSLLIALSFLFILSIPSYPETTKAPNIIAYTIPDGKLFNLRKLKNHPFLLFSFSATYCKPCKAEIKHLSSLQNSLSTNNIRIFLIFVDRSEDKIINFVKQNKISLPVLHDKFGIVSKKFNVKALPTSFLLDPHQNIILSIKGFNPYLLNKIPAIIKNYKKGVKK